MDTLTSDIGDLVGPIIAYMLAKGHTPKRVEEVINTTVSMKITELTIKKKGKK